MKNIATILLAVLLFAGISCKQPVPQAAQQQPVAVVSGNDIEVYYFHMTTRCVTCRAVEAETRKNIEMLYPEQFNTGKITFTALNIDEESGKFMGDQLGISGQTLLIVKGDKKFNITSEGFMYAEGKPEKYQSIIKQKIDSLLVD
jgi:hypothetical protein